MLLFPKACCAEAHDKYIKALRLVSKMTAIFVYECLVRSFEGYFISLGC
jgi:hypothetical protein